MTSSMIAAMQCLQRTEDGLGFPGSGVTYGCDPPCQCWKLNIPGPLQEQQMCQTSAISADPRKQIGMQLRSQLKLQNTLWLKQYADNFDIFS